MRRATTRETGAAAQSPDAPGTGANLAFSAEEPVSGGGEKASSLFANALLNLKRPLEIAALLAVTALIRETISHQNFGWVFALTITLGVYGFRKPHNLLTLALILSPLSVGLTGDLDDHATVIFSVSDVLLLAALPSALLRLRCQPDAWKLGGMAFPMLCYLLAGLLSFGINIRFMHGHSLTYFSGWLRNAQYVLMIPLLFASVEWPWNRICNALRGYLVCVVAVTLFALSAFWNGMRHGVYVLGIHKNVLGLALMLAALITLVALLPPARRGRGNAPRPFLLGAPVPLLIGVFAVCLLGLVCSLSRGSLLSFVGGLFFICLLRKRPALLVVLLLLTAMNVCVVRWILPPDGQQYTTDFSTQSSSVGDRLDMIRNCVTRFRAHPLLGDGFRIRRDILPHNLEATVFAENGLIGAGLLVWGMTAQFRLLQRGYRMFSQEAPLESFVVIASVCVLVLLIHGQMEPYWRRGPLLLPWAATGMVWALILQRVRATSVKQAPELQRGLVEPAELETIKPSLTL